MKDLLAKQNEHLEIIANLMKTDRLMQLAQTYGIREIDKEDSHSSDKLDEIASSIRLATDSQKDERRERKDRYKQEDETGKKHLDELKKIQISLVENNNLRDVADKSKDAPIFTTFTEDFNSLKDMFGGLKDKLTGGNALKSAKEGILSAVSPRYADRLDYMKNEKSLGNIKEDKELKEDYDSRSHALQANVKNEAELTKRRGSLTEEEYLKGNKDWAPTYLENKTNIGKEIKRTDSRYRLDDELETAPSKTNIPLKESVDIIAKEAKTQAAAVSPMAEANVVTREDTIEANRTTALYQDTQLANATEQTSILKEQLEVQKTILELLKTKLKEDSTGSDGIGFPDIPIGKNKPTGRVRGSSKRAQKARAKNKGTIKSRRAEARRTKMSKAKTSIPKGAPGAPGTRSGIPSKGGITRGTPSVGDIKPEIRPSNGKGLISESTTSVKAGAKKAITTLGETAIGKSVLGGAAKVSKAISPALGKTLESSRKVLGWLGKVPGLGTILTAADIYMRIDELDEQVKAGTLPETEYKHEVTKAIGSALGSTGGALAGGALGTLAGGPIGMILGGIGGAIGGERVGEMVADKLFDLVSSGEEPPIATPVAQTAEVTPVSQATPVAQTAEVTPVSQATPVTPVSAEVTPVSQATPVTPVSTEGYQAYTPKPEDSISTPTRPVITGNETEAELDEMNKSLGYSVVDLNPTKATPEQSSNVDLGDKGWMNPQVETTPRPSIEQQLDALDAAQNAPTKTIPEQIVPTKTIPEQNIPKQSMPEQNAPTNAESIYNQSAETTASSMPAAAPIINNISSPTTNVVGGGKSSKSPMANVKHEESSVLKMFESRQRFL